MYRFLYWLVLSRLPAEWTHRAGFFALRALVALPPLRALCARLLAPRGDDLRVQALGLNFPSPLGLAAGFDKDAMGFAALGALGFGHVEVGTLTGEPQPGNPRPRLFRLRRDRALVNRMGFNNRGAQSAAQRLARRRGSLIVGANIGKTKRVTEDGAIADYEKSARLLAPFVDYLVVNVSSPNTPGLRNLQAVDRLRPLLLSVQRCIQEVAEGHVPLLVKIAPDLADEDVDEVADLALELGLDGIIATNTTISRCALESSEQEIDAVGAGGLSGAPLKTRSLEVLRRLRARTDRRLVLISVGGIESGEDVFERLQAGATLVQAYTGFVYGGPLWPWRVTRQLQRRLGAAGASDVRQTS